MHEEILSEIGLTKSEIAMYLALLELGSSTTGPIIKKAQIASGKAYLTLDKLILKGLVTHVIKSGIKYYQAKDPENLLDYLKNKENDIKQKGEELKKIIPSLKIKFKEQKWSSIAEIYEGNKGFKSFYEWALTELKEGDTINVMGVSSKSLERYNSYLVEWNQRRIAKGVKLKIIYNSDAIKFGKVREKMKLTEVRYMKKDLETPAWIDIFKDYVVTINVHGEPFCFLLQNKDAAESYTAYFNYIWKQSTELDNK